jgi:hypothetical protein
MDPVNRYSSLYDRRYGFGGLERFSRNLPRSQGISFVNAERIWRCIMKGRDVIRNNVASRFSGILLKGTHVARANSSWLPASITFYLSLVVCSGTAPTRCPSFLPHPWLPFGLPARGPPLDARRRGRGSSGVLRACLRPVVRGYRWRWHYQSGRKYNERI